MPNTRDMSEAELAAAIRQQGSFTIDLTPSWRGVLPILLAGVSSGTVEGRRLAMAELERMADLADAYVAEHPREKKSG